MEENTTYFKEFYTLEQLSAELDITVRTLREEIKKGKLPASKIGHKYIMQREDIKSWLDHSRTK